MSNHHLLLSVQTLMGSLQSLVEVARDIERRLLDDEASGAPDQDEQDEIITHIAPQPPRRPRRRTRSADTIAAHCRACHGEVRHLMRDGALLNLDGTEHAETCAMKHVVCAYAGRAARQVSRATPRQRCKKDSTSP